MSTNESVSGSCLCGAIAFELIPPFTAFRYCHCHRCQKTSGSAHAANLFLPTKHFKWTKGEVLIKRFDLPQAKRFAVCFCQDCGSRVPHEVSNTPNMLIPAGLLDQDPSIRPENSIFWKFKAPWYMSPNEMPLFNEYP
jgi:hypothetical protein